MSSERCPVCSQAIESAQLQSHVELHFVEDTSANRADDEHCPVCFTAVGAGDLEAHVNSHFDNAPPVGRLSDQQSRPSVSGAVERSISNLSASNPLASLSGERTTVSIVLTLKSNVERDILEVM
jgi:hypothetical protein